MKILVEKSVLRQALEALDVRATSTERATAITALRTALDAAEKVEPVAFIQRTMIDQFGEWVEVFDLNMLGHGTPLYEHPEETP